MLIAGDSIATGWAEKVAAAYGVTPLNIARGGAKANDVQAALEQAPSGFKLVCLSVGTNDATSKTPNLDTLRDVVFEARSHGDRLVVTGLPARLKIRGFRTPLDVIETVNATLTTAAQEAGGLFVDLRWLTGPRYMRPDRVHPTRRGEHAIAKATLDALDGPELPALIERPWFDRAVARPVQSVRAYVYEVRHR